MERGGRLHRNSINEVHPLSGQNGKNPNEERETRSIHVKAEN